VEDAQSGALSVRNLRELLIFLGESTRVRRIHLIGYSAGAQVLADALLQLRLLHRSDDAEALQRRLRIGRVLYPAPDLDVMYARNLELDAVGDVAQASTIYVSRDDSALWASARLLFKAPRLGRPDNALTQADLEKLRGEALSAFVDPGQAQRSAGRGDGFGHTYWYSNPWVSTDALLFLRYGLAPADRGLVRSDSGTYWIFPENYPLRLRDVLWDLEQTAPEQRAR
jgi:esterase/lipase superfamily enzyme